MRIINDRYEIKKKYAETLNSLVFSARDLIKKRDGIIVKILNRNVKKRFPVEYFKIEYRATSILEHPLIRKTGRFYKIYSIDGTVMNDGEYFYTALEKARVLQENLQADKKRFFNEAICGLSFMHRAGYFHGDIRISNFLVEGNETFYFDLSPFLDPDEGRAYDMKKIAGVMKKLGISIHSEEGGVWDQTGHPLFDAHFQEELLYRHLDEVSFPSAFWALDLKDGQDLIRGKRKALLRYNGDKANVRLFAKGLIPALETEDFKTLWVGNTEEEEFLGLIRYLLLYFARFDYGKKLIGRHGEEYCKIAPLPDYHPSRPLRNENAEKTKLKEMGLQFLKDLTAAHPLALIIEDSSRLDPFSVELLRAIESQLSPGRLFVLHTSGKDLVEKEEEIKVEKLTKGELRKLLAFYFHLFSLPEKWVDDIWEETAGEPVLIEAGLQNIARQKGIRIIDGSYETVRPVKEYFDFNRQYEAVFSQCTADERDLLGMLYHFNGYIPATVQRLFPASYDKAVMALAEKNIIVSGEGISLKYDVLKKNIGLPGPNNLYSNMISAISKHLEENYSSVFPFIRMVAVQKAFGEALDDFLGLYESLKENQKAPLHRGFYQALKHLYSHFADIPEGKHFSILYALSREDIKKEFDYHKICTKMDALARTREEKYQALAVALQYDIADIPRAKKAYAVFDEKDRLPEKLWLKLTASLLEYLSNHALSEDAITLFEEKIKPQINTFHFETRFALYSAISSTYLRMNDFAMLAELGAKMLEIATRHEEELPRDMVFSAYNVSGIAHRGDPEKALEYYQTTGRIAREMHNDMLQAIVYNNTAVVYYEMNRPEKHAEFLLKAIECGERGLAYPVLFTAVTNLMENYILDFKYGELMEIARKFEPLVDKLDSVESVHSFYTIYARAWYHLGRMDKMDEYFEKVSSFYEKKKETRQYFQYFILKVLFSYFHQGAREASTLMETVSEDSYFRENPAKLYNLYAALTYYLFPYSELHAPLKKIVTLLFNEYWTYRSKTEPQYQYSVELFMTWSGLHPQPGSVVMGDAHFFTVKMLFLHVALSRRDKLSLEETNLAAFYLMMMEQARKGLQEEEFDLVRKTPFWQMHEKTLEEKGICAMGHSGKEYIASLASRARSARRKKEASFFAGAHYHNMLDVEQLSETCIKDVMRMYDVTRGIYYEFDPVKKWVKKKEIFDPMYHYEDEPVMEPLLTRQLFLEEDNIQFWESDDPMRDRGIFQAFAFPVIDIAVARSSEGLKGSSFSTMLSMNGCFYFDTKKGVTRPRKKEVRPLYYMREYANATLYYNLLKETVLFDPLTRLYKRDSWLSLAKDLQARQRKTGGKMAVIMGDIDYFKSINDEFGHKKGDEVLKGIAGVFVRSTRHIDIIGRYGGEEFVFALMVKKRSEALMIADRICRACEKESLVEKQKVTVSLGVSLYPDDGEILDELIEKADAALYESKEAGRNRFTSWPDVRGQKAGKRVSEAVITNPARDKDKIACLIGLSRIETGSGTCEDVISRANEILDSLFNGSVAVSIIDAGGETFYVSGEGPFSSEKKKDRWLADIFVPIYESDQGKSRARVYYNNRNSSLNIHMEKSFAVLTGQIILEKVLLARYREGKGGE